MKIKLIDYCSELYASLSQDRIYLARNKGVKWVYYPSQAVAILMQECCISLSLRFQLGLVTCFH